VRAGRAACARMVSRAALCAPLLFAACGAPRVAHVGLDEDPLVDVAARDPRIVVELTYASERNFVGQVLYASNQALLRRSAFERLARVQDRLDRYGLRLKLWDAYRPLAVQRRMWALVPDPRFVADPSRGSRHNRGMAVDVTLVDENGHELAMPSGHDEFSEVAHVRYDGCDETRLQNRDLLIRTMEAEGFTVLESEWWHFDAQGWEARPVLDVVPAGFQH